MYLHNKFVFTVQIVPEPVLSLAITTTVLSNRHLPYTRHESSLSNWFLFVCCSLTMTGRIAVTITVGVSVITVGK